MSTHIETLTGIKESFLVNDSMVETTIAITRFWGGSEKGGMLQLTVSNDEGYIQFTESEVIELAKILLNSFNDEIYPSE